MLQVSLHLVGSLDMPVLADVVAGILNGSAVLDARLTSSGSWASAVTADINSFAQAVILVMGDVVHA